jgi:membrane protein YdbS with pleckstrin-like domain
MSYYNMVSKLSEFELFPEKTPFVKFHFLKSVFGSIIILSILWAIINLFYEIHFLFVLVLVFLWGIWKYLNLNAAYKKAVYSFRKNRIVRHGGNLISDFETELIIKNITHVTVIRPFLEYMFFKTGHIVIEAAGSGRSEVVLFSVANPEEAYKRVKQVMRENGFCLDTLELLQHEKPKTLGVVFEIGGSIVGILFFAIVFLPVLLGIIESFSQNYFATFFLSVAFITALIVGVVHFIILFLDLINRDYFIYSKMVEYDEGFMTKVDSFIPIENISDVIVSQTLIEMVFDLYHVQISCQGAGQEIVFKNISNGKAMENNLSRLIQTTTSLVNDKSNKEKFSGKNKTEKTPVEKYSFKAPKINEDFSAEYRMDTAKTIISSLIIVTILLIVFSGGGGLLFLIIVGPVVIVSGLIQISANKYIIGKNSFGHKFSFLNKKNIEFSIDKVTGLYFKQDIFDMIFNTFSLDVWSIGSTEDIVFKNVKKNEGIYEKIASKIGVVKGEPIYECKSYFSVIELIKSNIFVSLLVGLVITGLIVFSLFDSSGFGFVFGFILMVGVLLILGIIIFFKKMYYKNSRVVFYRDFVFAEYGWLIKHKFYVLYNNVKDIETVKYVMSEMGSIHFNVAGEAIVSNGKNSYLSIHGFTLKFIKNIRTKDDLIDLIFYSNPNKIKVSEIESNIQKYVSKDIIYSKPSVINSVIWPLIIFVVLDIVGLLAGSIFFAHSNVFILAFVVFIILQMFVLGWIIWFVKNKSFSIQPYRVVSKWGIFYKCQKSIIFPKIDHINKFEGLTNKIFKNGSVVVNTTGSRFPELILTDMKDYNLFYAELEKYY